jgi:multiple sugar transport system permease protein
MKVSSENQSVTINREKAIGFYQIKKAITPWLFLLPGISITFLLRYYTIYQGFKLSFFHYNVANPPGVFVGVNNFLDLFRNSDYWQAWNNTLVFLVLIISLNFFIPIIQALLLGEIIKLRGMFSTFYILPAVIPATVNIVLWKWIWNPDFGVANYIMKFFGVDPKTWLSDASWVKFCIVLPGIIGGGLAVLLYLAAILGISEDVKEASIIDGCTGIKRMFFITLPNIKFLILIQFILTTMGALQLLDGPFQFTDGTPAGASRSLPLLIYHFYTKNYDYGQGSAAAMTLMLIISIITVIQLKLNNQESD